MTVLGIFFAVIAVVGLIFLYPVIVRNREVFVCRVSRQTKKPFSAPSVVRLGSPP